MRVAHVWQRQGNEWGRRALDAAVCPLADGGRAGFSGAFSAGTGQAAIIRLAADGAAASSSWALVAPPGVRVQVNGRAPVAGLRVLEHRDLIRTADGGRYFFTCESQAVVESFPGADRAMYCGRCRQRLDHGSAAVCCPGCGVWYHQGTELPCWTYDEHCVYCSRATALDQGCTWTPED